VRERRWPIPSPVKRVAVPQASTITSDGPFAQ
jgi:hypothetical protein